MNERAAVLVRIVWFQNEPPDWVVWHLFLFLEKLQCTFPSRKVYSFERIKLFSGKLIFRSFFHQFLINHFLFHLSIIFSVKFSVSNFFIHTFYSRLYCECGFYFFLEIPTFQNISKKLQRTQKSERMMESGPNERVDYHQPVITEKFAAILRHSS